MSSLEGEIIGKFVLVCISKLLKLGIYNFYHYVLYSLPCYPSILAGGRVTYGWTLSSLLCMLDNVKNVCTVYHKQSQASRGVTHTEINDANTHLKGVVGVYCGGCWRGRPDLPYFPVQLLNVGCWQLTAESLSR